MVVFRDPASDRESIGGNMLLPASLDLLRLVCMIR